MTQKSIGEAALHRLASALSGGLALCASLLVAALMCLIVVDVARRQLTGRSIIGVLEYSEIVMVLIVYLSLGYGQMTRSHVAVDLFLTRLAPKARIAVDTAVLLTTGLLLLWFAFHATDSALSSFERLEVRPGLAGVPVWPAKLAIPLGVLAMAVQCFAQIHHNIRTMRSPHEESLIQQS
ncbi:TRAP transporter small permease subunit [Nesterenkonia haasae]|uniref:TRAP transporter small permease subunit n=1 Tax=Nesterenkonia haasae TaxID=2587813 RepID=UPI0013909F9F|nr:TRAP transporter small permease subunit [Nesterenkonia haasae]NDK33260.1 TRAP transporter small permease [Nesterenkonia haasae]